MGYLDKAPPLQPSRPVAYLDNSNRLKAYLEPNSRNLALYLEILQARPKQAQPNLRFLAVLASVPQLLECNRHSRVYLAASINNNSHSNSLVRLTCRLVVNKAPLCLVRGHSRAALELESNSRSSHKQSHSLRLKV